MTHHRLLQTRLSRQLGIDTPVFGFCHSPAVVAAICNAGGFGVLGATRHTPEEIEHELAWIRQQVGSRPFGVNLVLPDGMPEHNDREAIENQLPLAHRAFVQGLIEKYQVPPGSGPGERSRFVRSSEVADQQLEAVLRSDANLLACGIGAPADVIDRAKAGGKKVLALVGSPNMPVLHWPSRSIFWSRKATMPARTQERLAPFRWCHKSWTWPGKSQYWPPGAWPRDVTSTLRWPWAHRVSGWEQPG